MRPTTVALAQVEGEVSLSAVASAAGAARNVGAVVLDHERDEALRVRSAFEEIDRRQTTYVVTDADPYGSLRDAFVSAWQCERLEDFELAALGARPTPLPDFYFVLDAGTPEVSNFWDVVSPPPAPSCTRLEGTFDIDDARATAAPDSIPIGFKNNIVLQRRIRIVSVAGNVRSTAIVEVNGVILCSVHCEVNARKDADLLEDAAWPAAGDGRLFVRLVRDLMR